jgi:GH25 family lysozyme M1 (1,4-beta-N-acetylmuramidase)
MLIGVDYASVDGSAPPDWQRAEDAGVRFAIIRGTYERWIDPTLHRDWDTAGKAGLKRSSYLFPVMGVGHPEPEQQVAAFAKALADIGGLDKLTCFPPTLDIEFPGGIAKTGHTRAELLVWIRKAITAMKDTFGAWPMLYTSGRVWNSTDVDCLGNPPAPDLVDCPLWLAHYAYKAGIPLQRDPGPDPVVPTPWGDADNWWIHQYQGDAKPFPGFTSTTDVNRFHVMWPGAKGARVAWMQRKLKMAEGTPAVYDDVTKAAVLAFQTAHGLDADGVIGPATFIALCWA